jgi:hypothetical protein
MKNLLLIFTLLFSSVFFSSPSYAGWTEVTEDVKRNTYYVDFERIKKVDGNVYFWDLTDLLKPNEDGDLSYKSYFQGDCKLFRVKILSQSKHNQPMGGGTGHILNKPDKWRYPSPESTIELILKSVCSR